jgi:hypothetical protein
LVELVCDCLFDGAFSKRRVHPGPEKAYPAAGSTGVCGVERKPTVPGLDNMAQMPLVIRKSADRRRIPPQGGMETRDFCLANGHCQVSLFRIVQKEHGISDVVAKKTPTTEKRSSAPRLTVRQGRSDRGS